MLKWVGFGIAILLAAATGALAAGLWLVDELRDANAYRRSIATPAGVDELIRVEIGGIEQSLQLRGHDRSQPLLLLLHGGPGGTVTKYAHEFQTPWEEYFVVVNWDQRGSGRSAYPVAEIKDSLNLERLIADVDEIVDYLRDRFDQNRIVLLGTSWGTLLGAHYAHRFPEKLHAYVGWGQFVSKIAHTRDAYERALELARLHGDDETLKALLQLDQQRAFPDPNDPAQTGQYRFALPDVLPAEFEIPSPLVEAVDAFSHPSRAVLAKHGEMTWYQMRDGARTSDAFLAIGLTSHTLTREELRNTLFRPPWQERPDRWLYEYSVRSDIREDIGFRYEVPFITITGKHDYQTSRDLARAYFDQIEAPYKKWVWLEHSAHGVILDEPGRFFVALVNEVLPLTRTDADPG